MQNFVAVMKLGRPTGLLISLAETSMLGDWRGPDLKSKFQFYQYG